MTREKMKRNPKELHVLSSFELEGVKNEGQLLAIRRAFLPERTQTWGYSQCSGEATTTKQAGTEDVTGGCQGTGVFPDWLLCPVMLTDLQREESIPQGLRRRTREEWSASWQKLAPGTDGVFLSSRDKGILPPNQLHACFNTHHTDSGHFTSPAASRRWRWNSFCSTEDFHSLTHSSPGSLAV